MSYEPLTRAFSKRAPKEAAELLFEFQRETLPALQQMHARLSAILADLAAGTLVLGNMAFSQGTGAPTSTPTTLAAIYFRLDPGVGTSVYAWNGATWSAL